MKQHKRAKAPIDLMLHMHLSVTQSFKTHKNVSQNIFCNIVLGFHCLHLDCAVLAVEITPNFNRKKSVLVFLKYKI